jgi:Zn-finger nucleic acid-binding protein
MATMAEPGTVTCPSCGKRTSGAARRCAQCGAVVERVRPRVAGPLLACPGCKRATETLVFGGVELDGCLGCGGVWFDDGEVNALAAELTEEELARDALQAARTLTAEGREPKTPEYVACPVCGELASRRNYHDVSGVILHRCDGHGAWLDHANVIRFLTIVSNGGMRELDQRELALRTQQQMQQLAEVEVKRAEMVRQEDEAEERRDWGVVNGVLFVIRLILGL